MLIPLFAALILMPQTPTASTADDKGTALFRECQAQIRMVDGTSTNTEKDFADGQYCVGYVQGFTTGVIYSGGSICFDEATAGTLVRVYVAFMERNPKMLDDDKYLGLARALSDAYPCSKPKSKH